MSQRLEDISRRELRISWGGYHNFNIELSSKFLWRFLFLLTWILLVEGLPQGRGRTYMERTEGGGQKGYPRPRPTPPPTPSPPPCQSSSAQGSSIKGYPRPCPPASPAPTRPPRTTAPPQKGRWSVPIISSPVIPGYARPSPTPTPPPAPCQTLGRPGSAMKGYQPPCPPPLTTTTVYVGNRLIIGYT